jgi:hypothetical protein
VWLGSSSLAIQFWDIYCIINEQGRTITELWDGNQLKCTFHRCVDRRKFVLWEELVNLASAVNLTNEEDELIWQFTSSGVYSSQSLYSVINFRGVTPIFVPSVWKLKIPPRV